MFVYKLNKYLQINQNGSSSLCLSIIIYVRFVYKAKKKKKFPVSETGADIFHCTDWQIQETYFFLVEKIENNVQCNSKV